MSPANRDLAQLIGENIQALRKRQGISQEELSFRAGLHRTEVSQLELGLRLPRADTAIKMAGGLGVEIGELFANIAWRPGELLEGLTWIPAGPALGRFRIGEEDANEAKQEGKAAKEASQEEP